MKLVKQVSMQNDRILVYPHPVEDTSRGGIIIPHADKQRESRATVMAVGPGSWNNNGERNRPLVKPGHTIVYGKYVGTEVELEVDNPDVGVIKKRFIAIREDDIIAVIEE